jgi:hypothetical protein
MLQKNMSPSCSGSKNKPSNKPNCCFTLVSCLVYSSTMKMEAICCSESLLGFQRTIWRYIHSLRGTKLSENKSITVSVGNLLLLTSILISERYFYRENNSSVQVSLTPMGPTASVFCTYLQQLSAFPDNVQGKILEIILL